MPIATALLSINAAPKAGSAIKAGRIATFDLPCRWRAWREGAIAVVEVQAYAVAANRAAAKLQRLLARRASPKV